MGFMLFPISFVNGEVQDYTTYSDYTEIPATIAWDSDAGAEYYNFELFHYEHNLVSATGNTQQTQITINFPRSGHYIFKVRSCTSQQPTNTTGLTQVGSDWCTVFSESTDVSKATVNGQSKAWWIYRHVSPPGTVEIEN